MHDSEPDVKLIRDSFVLLFLIVRKQGIVGRNQAFVLLLDHFDIKLDVSITLD